jgi:hypothetical protein
MIGNIRVVVKQRVSNTYFVVKGLLARFSNTPSMGKQ